MLDAGWLTDWLPAGWLADWAGLAGSLAAGWQLAGWLGGGLPRWAAAGWHLAGWLAGCWLAGPLAGS